MTRKIAILGGGAASLFAAWNLVRSERHPHDAYDITVYQLGWRLGGKGASGRGASGRIEEHGLHLMFGFYENVFRMMREAYAEYYGDSAMWLRFFRSENTAVSMIRYLDAAKTRWEPWHIPYPTANSLRTPGDGGEHGGEHSGEAILTIVRNALSWVEGLVHRQVGAQHHTTGTHLGELGDVMHALFDAPLRWVLGSNTVWTLGRDIVDLIARSPGHAGIPLQMKAFETALEAAAHLLERLWPAPIDQALLSLIRFVLTVVRGLFVDLLVRGSRNWFELDDYDLRDWIRRHGGDPSAPAVEGLYDAVFASYSRLGTGSILQAALKAAFLFKGSVIYKMQAGMGDTIFTPLYRALEKRGVTFKFFHRVESLTPSPDRRFVDSVVLERQVLVDRYDPLVKLSVDVGGPMELECWPSEPLWDRLPPEERARIAGGGIDLENHWTDPDPARQITIRRGSNADFDDVILGISVAALPALCPELLDNDEPFFEHVRQLAGSTTATQAMQLWTAHGRMPRQPNPLIVPNVDPYDTIADMGHLVRAECHQPGLVGGVHYLCSALLEDSPPSLRSDRDYPGRIASKALENGRDWVTRRAPLLWANLATEGAFDWSALYDPDERVGPERFRAQLVTTPRNLSDRYVIPAPMTHRVRLMSNETRYQNLYITGDWIKTSLSIGCLEAAAMAGIQAARAVSLETDNPSVPRASGDWIDDVKRRVARPPAAGALAPATYRHRDGELLVPPPYGIRCDGLYMFVLHADRERLRAVCENELNIGGLHYQPYDDIVILYGSHLSHLAAGSSGDAQEIGIWLPVVVEGQREIRIYSPYIWIDSATSTIVGRSVYGYTKLTAEVSVPSAEGAGAFTVTGDCLLSSDGGLQLKRDRLVTVSQRASPAGARARGLAELPQVEELVEHFGRDPIALLRMFDGMKSVFLKQLPHVSGSNAAYQAIVEADIRPNLDTVSARVLTDPWTIEIPIHHEPQLVERLGLVVTETTSQADLRRTAVVTPIAQLWMRFEGSIEPGVIVHANA